MQDLAIYMVTHKAAPAPDDKHYIPIQGGAAINPSLGILRDDSGVSISDRNPKYSELTALYWIWKNDRSKYIGLTHYRRFFESKYDATDHNDAKIASGADILEQLNKCDILVLEPIKFTYPNTKICRSVENQYVSSHRAFDLLQARRAISELCDAYLPSFDFVMRNNRLIAHNLFASKREILEEYCSWLFPLVFQIDKYTNLPEDEDFYQGRVIAFLSERLFTTWLCYNRAHLRVSYRPLVFYVSV